MLVCFVFLFGLFSWVFSKWPLRRPFLNSLPEGPRDLPGLLGLFDVSFAVPSNPRRCAMRGMQLELSSLEEQCRQHHLDYEGLQAEMERMEEEQISGLCLFF